MRNFLDTIQGANVVQSVNAGRQTSVQTEDLVIDESGEGEVVEEISEQPITPCVSLQIRCGRSGCPLMSYFQTLALPYLRRHSS